MANRSIPNLAPAIFVSPTAQIEIVQDGVTYRASAGAIGALGGGPNIVNNITETEKWYPVYASITGGTMTTGYVSNPYYHYLPVEGRLSALRLEATQGIVYNANTATMDYVFPLNDNATSCGPITLTASVTVPTDSVWMVV